MSSSGLPPGISGNAKAIGVVDQIKGVVLIVGVLLVLVGASSASAAASLKDVNEYGSLSLERSKGATIDERGRGSGTFSCAVYIELTLSGTLVSARYSAYPHGGSIQGMATAHIHSATTKFAYFSGTITLNRGTGSFAHASGTASFTGSIDRSSYAMTVRVAGRLTL